MLNKDDLNAAIKEWMRIKEIDEDQLKCKHGESPICEKCGMDVEEIPDWQNDNWLHFLDGIQFGIKYSQRNLTSKDSK